MLWSWISMFVCAFLNIVVRQFLDLRPLEAVLSLNYYPSLDTMVHAEQSLCPALILELF